jgi:hypothetical protein
MKEEFSELKDKADANEARWLSENKVRSTKDTKRKRSLQRKYTYKPSRYWIFLIHTTAQTRCGYVVQAKPLVDSKHLETTVLFENSRE